MVDPQTTLGEQLLDLAIGERKAQVPADREQDHLRLKLAPLEQSGNRWGEEHRPSLSGQTSKLATLPKGAMPHLDSVLVWPLSDFRDWAKEALGALRELRRSFGEP